MFITLVQTTYILRKSLQTTSALSVTSTLYFEQPAASFLVCSLIFKFCKIAYRNFYLTIFNESNSLYNQIEKVVDDGIYIKVKFGIHQGN